MTITKSYTVPSPMPALAEHIPFSVGFLRDIFVEDLGWTVEFDNLTTLTPAVGHAGPFIVNGLLSTAANGNVQISQVRLRSPCTLINIWLFWSTLTNQVNTAVIWRRANQRDAQTGANAGGQIMFGTHANQQDAANSQLIYEIDQSLNDSFAILRRHITAAGANTITGSISYERELKRNIDSVPGASAINFTVGISGGSLDLVPRPDQVITRPWQIAQSIGTQTNHTAASGLLTTPVPFSTQNIEFFDDDLILCPVIIAAVPAYTMPNWYWAVIQNSEAQAADIFIAESRIFKTFRQRGERVRAVLELRD